MKSVELYINGKRADLDDASFVLMNWTRDEASNPATIRNSFSQQVSLPATKANAEIFGYYENPTRVTAEGLDPLVRTPFKLFSSAGIILATGYIKLDTIKRSSSGVVAYNVTLYGGLGGLFYALTSKADGLKMSLSDMTWVIPGAEDDPIDKAEPISLTAETVKNAWDTLDTASPVDYPIYHLLNFAPCLNGIPESGFDAGRAFYRDNETLTADSYAGLASVRYLNSVQYFSRKKGCIVATLPEKMTEWEIEDLRAYLQRPVVNVWAFLKSIQRTANVGLGYDFELDADSFTTPDNSPWLGGAWFTLPIFDRASFKPNTATFEQIMKGTPSPAEVLISIAKAYGLVFLCDDASGKVTLMTRARFYNSTDVVDLEPCVAGEVEIVPNLVDKKFYTWSLAVPGAFGKQYKETYGVESGSQRVNTGYEFNNETTNVMAGSVLKGCAEVQDVSKWYFTKEAAEEPYKYDFKGGYGGDVSWELQNADGKVEQFKQGLRGRPANVPYYGATAGTHFAILPQFCDGSRKAADGSMVLLFFDGMQNIKASVPFNLTNDTPEMLELNNGVPCWNVTLIQSRDVVKVSSIPKFRRVHGGYTFDFGFPLVLGYPGVVTNLENLYQKNWAKYIEDRFDKDTKVLRCKVDLSRLPDQPGAEMLRRFYFYKNCLWSLNKITNYSTTTDDLTECEFVQVRDTKNYI